MGATAHATLLTGLLVLRESSMTSTLRSLCRWEWPNPGKKACRGGEVYRDADARETADIGCFAPRQSGGPETSACEDPAGGGREPCCARRLTVEATRREADLPGAGPLYHKPTRSSFSRGCCSGWRGGKHRNHGTRPVLGRRAFPLALGRSPEATTADARPWHPATGYWLLWLRPSAALCRSVRGRTRRPTPRGAREPRGGHSPVILLLTCLAGLPWPSARKCSRASVDVLHTMPLSPPRQTDNRGDSSSRPFASRGFAPPGPSRVSPWAAVGTRPSPARSGRTPAG